MKTLTFILVSVPMLTRCQYTVFIYFNCCLILERICPWNHEGIIVDIHVHAIVLSALRRPPGPLARFIAMRVAE